MTETVLIVDDEDGVRRTFQEWLAGMPGVTVYAATRPTGRRRDLPSRPRVHRLVRRPAHQRAPWWP